MLIGSQLISHQFIIWGSNRHYASISPVPDGYKDLDIRFDIRFNKRSRRITLTTLLRTDGSFPKLAQDSNHLSDSSDFISPRKSIHLPIPEAHSNSNFQV